jgi:uracil-DNA glycosylase family 4
MRFKRTASDCANCPLRDRERVWGIGPDDVGKIILIGESPGMVEEMHREPFVGPAGKYLTWGLSSAGILRHRCWITNLISCRPPGDNLSSPEGLEAVRRCAPGLEQELNFILAHVPGVIVPLGGEAASALAGGRLAVTRVRGSVADYHGIPVVPTFHPSYLNRMSREQGEKGKPFFKYVWIADLKKAKRIAASGWVGPAERFSLSPTLEELEAYTSARQREHSLMAVDIETTGRGAQTQIVVVGLAHTGEDAISVPFLRQGGHPYWERNGDQHHVDGLLRALFSTNPLVFQNALFDVRVLRAKGYPIPPENVKHDVMLISHAVSPELPHDLGFITSCYGETPYWKNVMQDSDVGILDRLDEEVRAYNLRDCVVLHQCLPGLLVDLKETGTEKVYYEESMPLIEPIAAMMDNGIKLDEGRLRAYETKLKREKSGLEKDLKTLAALPAAFNLASDDDLRYFLYGAVPKKLQGVEEKLASKKRKDTKVYRELEELLELKEKTKSLVGIPVGHRPRSTQGGKFTVNEQGLLSLQRACQNRASYIEGLVRPKENHESERKGLLDLLKWLGLYYRYAEVNKLITTYMRFPVDPDGRVRTSFLIHGTCTGRLASRSPNLQNQPKEDLGIRKCFVPEDGNVFVSADYENLEVRVLAYESEDPVLIEAFEKGANLHDENTKTLFGLDKNSVKWKAARAAAKIFMFGGISYGGGDNEIYERVILKAPELGLTFAEFKNAKERYMNAHPAYRAWAVRVQSIALKERKSVNRFGRVRVLMGDERDILKEALNTPIQSTAASVINRALIRVYRRLREERFAAKLLLQIHDELLFEAPRAEVEKLKALLQEEMPRPVQYGARTVVFPIEIKTGPSWGELKA